MKVSRVDTALDMRRQITPIRPWTFSTPTGFSKIVLNARPKNSFMKGNHWDNCTVANLPFWFARRRDWLTDKFHPPRELIACGFSRLPHVPLVSSDQTCAKRIAQRISKLQMRVEVYFAISHATLSQTCSSWRGWRRPVAQIEIQEARLCVWSTTSLRNRWMLPLPPGYSLNRKDLRSGTRTMDRLSPLRKWWIISFQHSLQMTWSPRLSPISNSLRKDRKPVQP